MSNAEVIWANIISLHKYKDIIFFIKIINTNKAVIYVIFIIKYDVFLFPVW